MKKRIILCAAAAMAAFTAVSAHAEITVAVDEAVIAFEDQEPVILNDRTMVPLRKIFESLGAYVEWNDETKTVYAHRRLNSVSLTIGEDVYFVNGEERRLDTPAVILNSRTMIPVRAVAEALGAEVVWNQPTQTVAIASRGGEHEVGDIYLDFWEADADGCVLMTGRIAYPELAADAAPVVDAFNDFVAADAEECYENFVLEYLENAKSRRAAALKEGITFVPYMFDRSFDITYDSNKLISMICLDYTYSDTASANYNMYAMNYSLETGRLLDVTDVFSIDEQQIRKIVRDEFEAMIHKRPQDFYNDAIECLDEALAELNWYIGEDGIHFFVNPCDIAPASAGVIDILSPVAGGYKLSI